MAINGKGLVMGGHDGPLLPDGVVAPILTPFEADLSVSHDRLVAHAQRVLDEGCVGVAVFGTTGEALSVATREREAALEALVAGGIDPGVMIVGTGVTNLPGTVHLTRHAMELGCRACMVLRPSTSRTRTPRGASGTSPGWWSGLATTAYGSCCTTFPRWPAWAARSRW